MQLSHFLTRLSDAPGTITFEDTMAVIDKLYNFTPSAFTNGELSNETGENSGSCKIFSFAKLNNFNQQQTLDCFGQFYRIDVLQNPGATDHQNIRNFIKFGWPGIEFSRPALAEK